MKTWLASAALVGGATGGGVLALAAVSGPTTPTAAPQPSAPAATTGRNTLTAQTSALLAEDRALKRAVARARKRLGDEVAASEHSLAALRQRLVVTETALAQAQAAHATLAARVATPLVAAPVSHATTGASGAGRAGGGEVDD